MLGGKECIDKIEGLLADLGLKSTRRINDRKLRVTVEPKQGVRYVVYFIAQSERVLIEAVVSKSISGSGKSLQLFYETLLMYNASVFPFSLAMTKLMDGTQNIILRYTPSCYNIEAYELKHSVLSLNEAFAIHVPRIKELADEYHLKFTGHDEFNVAGIVKAIIGLD